MADHDDDSDEHDDHNHDHSATAADPVLIALELCRIASSPKTIAASVKKLRLLDAQYADIAAKAAAIEAQVEQKHAALAERETAITAREVALEERAAAFESQAGDVRDELYAHHNRVEQAHRQLVHRIMSTAGIAGNWNFDLQGVPSWQQLKRQIADLPDDLPAAPPAEVVTREVTTDWTGNHNFISGSSLTRTVRGAA
jgi:hypothetical protein